MRAGTFVKKETWVSFDFMMYLNVNCVIHKARASSHKKTKRNTHKAAFYTLSLAPRVRGVNVSECLTLQSQLKECVKTAESCTISDVSRLSRPLLSAQCLNSGFFSSDGNDDDPAEVKFSIALKSARQKKKERKGEREREEEPAKV